MTAVVTATSDSIASASEAGDEPWPSEARSRRSRDSASAGRREAASNAAARRRPPCTPRRSAVLAGPEPVPLRFDGLALLAGFELVFRALACVSARARFCGALAARFCGAVAPFRGALARRCLVATWVMGILTQSHDRHCGRRYLAFVRIVPGIRESAPASSVAVTAVCSAPPRSGGSILRGPTPPANRRSRARPWCR